MVTINKTPNNPFYPGYFPGQTLPRKPVPKYMPPEEFDWDYTRRFIYDHLESLENVPKWFVEQMKQDVDISWRVFARPSKSGRVEVTDEMADDIDEYPGAVGISFNLKPSDWIQDPQKQLKKVWDASRRAVFNLNDLQLRVEQDDVWTPLVRGTADVSGLSGLGASSLEQQLRGGVGEMSLRGLGVEDTEAKRKMYDVGLGKIVETNKDAYEDYGENIVKFVGVSRAQFGRNGAYTKMQHSLVRALDLDIEKSIGSSAINATGANNVAQFRAKAKVLHSLGNRGLSKRDAGLASSLSKVSENLTKASTLKGGASKRTALRNAQKSIDKLVGGTGGTPGVLDQIRGDIASARSSLAGNTDALANFNSAVGTLEKKLDKIEKVLSPIQLSTTNLVKGTISATSLEGVVTGLKEELQNMRYGGGVEIKLLQNAVGDVLGADEGLASELVHTAGGIRARRYAGQMAARYEGHAMQDLGKVIDKGLGGFADELLWPRMRTRLGNVTPATIVRNHLKNTHYYGFYYDPKADNSTASKVVKKIPFLLPKHKFSARIGGKLIRGINGGKHFSAPALLGSALSNGVPLGDADLIYLLRARPGMGDLRHLATGTSGIKLSVDEVADLEEKLERFRLWLASNAKGAKKLRELGMTLNVDPSTLSPDELKTLADKFRDLFEEVRRREKDPALVNATFAYAGRFQKYTEVLSKLQKKFYKYGGKYVAPAVFWKAKVVSKIVDAIFVMAGVVTDGAGFILWFVKIALQYIINKIISSAEAALKAVLKGDFRSLSKEMEKLSTSFLKFAGAVIGIPLFGIIAIVMITISTIISAISPVDPSRTGTFVSPDFGDGSPVDAGVCMDDPDDGGLDTVTPATGPATTAYNLALGLERGFWCYYNHHPNYPNYWDSIKFEADPFPTSDMSGCWNCLFWCTKLPIETHSYLSGDLGLLGAQYMAEWYGYTADNADGTNNGHHFYANAEGANPGQKVTPEPGDVIFFKIPSRNASSIGHVAVVLEVTDDYIETAHSNAYLKRHAYTRDTTTGVVQNYTIGNNVIHQVVGFGR